MLWRRTWQGIGRQADLLDLYPYCGYPWRVYCLTRGRALSTHLFIPDLQVKPGVPTDHIDWIGEYIAERKPDRIINGGDTYDMASLSAWDRGKLAMEGRRYKEDIEVGNDAMARLQAPTKRINRGRRFRKTAEYAPSWDFILGNHEYRIERAVQDNPHLEGKIGYHDFAVDGWTVHDFLKPCWLDGICYVHYLADPMSGRPRGGLVRTRLDKVGHSFVMGHQQTFDQATRYILAANGWKQQRGIVAGACYLHDEDYKGPQGNAHWRGILVLHEVDDGAFCLMEVDLEFLARKYEGMPLRDFLRSKYPDMTGSLWQ